MVRLAYVLACTLLLICSAATNFAADELQLAAPRLMQTSVTRDVRLAEDGQSIVLERGVLYEDDGPAAGYCYGPNEEKLGPDIQIRKQLVIPDPRADRALVMVAQGGELALSVNGQPQSLDALGKTGQNWQLYTFSGSALKAGKNEFVVSGTGKIWIARDEDFAAGSRERTKHPNRSAKSTDGGKTWSDDKLGTGDNLDGEYYLRVFLDQYRPAGSLELPIIDAGNLGGATIAPAITAVDSLEIEVAADTPPETRVVLAVRTGASVVPDDKHWSPWQLSPGPTAKVEQPAGRFLQVRVELTTKTPLSSPQVREISIRAKPTLGSTWHSRVRVTEADNPALVRTSIPFEYEPLDHPRLAQLRKRYEIDKVVDGAKDELAALSKLAVWSSQRWEKIGHLAKAYPAWDALEILKLHADGTPVGGFCQHYNLVFLQACESLGFVGRAVSLSKGDHDLDFRSGHEVVEIWSNQFGKWIYIDGNAALYYADAETRVPLSLRELRERQLQLLKGQPYKPAELVALAPTKYAGLNLSSWPPFAELRLIPRSNFLAEKAPLPLHQGMKGWFWTGHYVWSDDAYPAAFIYGNRVTDPKNWDWTLNQAHIHLEATPTPGELRVRLDTETPGFETYLVDLDGAGVKKSPDNLVWKLHSGKNRLKARTRNISGREGAASLVVLEYGG
jgi:hypothetical protein